MVWRKWLISLIVMATMIVSVQAETPPSFDAQTLYNMAQHQWSSAQYALIQTESASPTDPEIKRQFQLATLYLQAAVENDPSFAQAWRDLYMLLISPAINDPGRAMDTLIQYSNLNPEDQGPVTEWIRYRFNSFDDTATQKLFLESNAQRLAEYPEVQSSVITQLGIFALQDGDIETARTHFNHAQSISPYNIDALDQLVALPDKSLGDVDPNQLSDIQTTYGNYRILQQFQQARLHIRLNPYDLQSTLILIDMLERYSRYELTKPFYQHVDNLITIAPTDALAVFAQLQLIPADKLESFQSEPATALQVKLKDVIAQKRAQINTSATTETQDDPADPIALMLNQSFGLMDLQIPIAPEKFISCKVHIDSDLVHYDDSIDATISLINVSPIDLPLGPTTCFDPQIAITAEITKQGSQPVKSKEILLAHRTLNQSMLLKPSESSMMRLPLNIGQLNNFLSRYPQQTFEIKINIYFDPIVQAEGQLAGKIAAIQPEPLKIKRTGFAPYRDRIRAQLDKLNSDSVQLQYRSAKLLTALVLESQRNKDNQLSYNPTEINPEAIVNAIQIALNSGTPTEKAHILAAIKNLRFTKKDALIASTQTIIKNGTWLDRFIAIDAMHSQMNLDKVLQWTIDNDQHPLLTRQAKLLLDQDWQIIEIDVPGN